MKFTLNVVQVVEVEFDESKFDADFFKAFSETMFPVDDLAELAEYVARHKALFDGYTCEFVPDAWYKAEVVDDYTEEA